MDVAMLGVMVPIVGIVLGLGGVLLKMVLNHQERMVDKRINAQDRMANDVHQEIAALRQEMLRLRDTSTQYDLSLQHTLEETQHRLATLEAKSRGTGQAGIAHVEEPALQKNGLG